MPTAAVTAMVGEFDTWHRENAHWLDLSPLAGQIAHSLTGEPALKLSAPDALHLATAIAEGPTLVTFDARLAAAASLRGHPVIVP